MILLTAALAAFGFATSCDKEQEAYPDFAQMISPGQVSTTHPRILETIGGKVPCTIRIDVPAGFTYPTASVALSAYLVWKGGETQSGSYGGFQGTELPDIGSTVISYETGGKVTMKTSFNYQPEMAKSELFLQFDVLYQDRHTVFRIKIADGVIDPSDL